MDCDDEPLTFNEQLLLAVAPVAVAACIEHLIAPLAGHFITAKAPTKRTKAKSRAAARGFASYVEHERRS